MRVPIAIPGTGGASSALEDFSPSLEKVVRVGEFSRELPFYRPVPLTALPLIYHREHLFPYTSYDGTDSSPVLRKVRMLVVENEFLRVEVAPELGGRVYSLFDKRAGRELLFSNPVIKPVRILPVWAFISGGIEFNFPVAHSPTSIHTVGCCTGRVGDYGFIRVGEREARTGMEWVVELGLSADHPVLVQRTALRNGSAIAHPCMMWSICAVRSTQDTEFIHPDHPALVHDDKLRETSWPGEGLNWDRNLEQMTAVFWKPGGSPHFGAFHHDLGLGLMHLADPRQLPGKKLWSYGHGKHRRWGEASTEEGLCYAEIESGPLQDQDQKLLFPSGTERRFEEYWIPVRSREECEQVSRPRLSLPAMEEPWLGWQHSDWQMEWEAFRAGAGPLPDSTVPTGLELESALRDALSPGNSRAGEPLALWLAFRGRPQEALALVKDIPLPSSQRIAGLILWKGLGQASSAVGHLEAGPLSEPIAVVELDQLYTEIGMTAHRQRLLSDAPPHRLVLERRADLALALGRPEETLRILRDSAWPQQHQRYVRTALWKAAQAALGNPAGRVPETLNEDNLAPFGAYWSEI